MDATHGCYNKSMSSTFRVKHNGRIQWCIKWKQEGKWHFVYDDNKSRVQDKQLARIAAIGTPQIERSKPSKQTINKKTNPTLNMLFDEHVEKANYKYNTYKNNQTNWKALRNNIGNIPIKTITKDDIQTAFNKLNAAPYTALKRWKLINICMNDAIKKGLIKQATNIERPKVVNRTRIMDNTYMDDYTRIIRGLLIWLENDTNQYHEWYAIVKMMNLGMRIGEVLGLTEESINHANQTLVINKQLTKEGKLTAGTKGRNGSFRKRIIPLPNTYYKALTNQIKANKKQGLTCTITYQPDGMHDATEHPIFINKNTNHTIRYDAFRRKWIEIQQAYHKEIEGDELTETNYIKPHTNRHITATILAEEQVPITMAQAILGHMDSDMTEYYTHITASMMKPIGEQYENAMNNTPMTNYINEVIKAKNV